MSEKLSRDDIKQMQTHLDNRFKTFKPTIIQEKKKADENAAGTRRQLLMNGNCISCDRPAEMSMTNDGTVLMSA